MLWPGIWYPVSMWDYKLLQALDMVVREGGFDKAARRLHITQSAVSQRIKALEEQTGRLLVTRSLPPGATATGKALLKHLLQVQSLEADLDRAVNGPETQGNRIFSLGINADSLATWFLPAVQEFVETHGILLDLKVDDQDLTHKLLRDGEVAGCISSEKQPVQGCRVGFIGTMFYDLVATPEFARRYFSKGFTTEAVASAPSVIYNRKDDLHDRYLKIVWPETPIPAYPIHYVPSSDPFVQMVAQGLAYGMVPRLQAAPFMADGRLIPVGPLEGLGVDLYWHRWNLASGLLDEFSRVIVERAVIC